MFTTWTKGFAANVYFRPPWNNWLHVGDANGQRDPVDVLLERAPHLDPFAFPAYFSQYSHEGLIRARQRECGVDVERADDPECQFELGDAIGAARASLRI